MTAMCAWCGKIMGLVEPFEVDSITHGICEKCKNVEREKLYKEITEDSESG